MSSPENPNIATDARGMNIAVPRGDDTFLVATVFENLSGRTIEDQLLNLGIELLSKPLTPNFGWSGERVINYVADPIDALGNALNGLSRILYEQQWMPAEPSTDEVSFIIYDFDKPAVEVMSLTAAIVSN